ncbi:MAG: hypothetical protein ABI080_06590 [Candidatus Binatia bacterium]
MQALATSGFRTIVVVAALVLAAASAQAFDLTGTWEGTYACKGSLVT